MGIIHHIRRLPKRTQAHVAFMIAFALAVGITLLWIPTLPARFEWAKESVTNMAEKAPERTGVADAIQGIASSSNGIKRQFQVQQEELVVSEGEHVREADTPAAATSEVIE